MRKLVSLLSILAVGMLVACSDDNGGNDAKPPGEGINFDGGLDGIVLPDGDGAVTPDGPGPACDPATIGKFWEYKGCKTDADCTGVGTGKCNTTEGVCEDTTDYCGKNTPFGMGSTEDGGQWGLCTCDCTADDPDTPLVNEDSCPDQANNMCSDPIPFLTGSCQSDADCAQYGTGLKCDTDRQRCAGTQAYCVRKCDPKLGTRTCDGKLACTPNGGYNFDMYYDTVCADKGCEKDDECPVSTGVTCDTHQDDCPNNGGKCYLLDYTVKCTADTDCKTGYWCKDLGDAGSPAKYCVTVEGHCYKPGKCDMPSGLCTTKPAGLFKAGAKVGDTCKGDVDCDKDQQCLKEIDYSKFYSKIGTACKDDGECCSNLCQGGVCAASGYNYCTTGYRNGYCTVRHCDYAATLTTAVCPAGSTCNGLYSFGGMCQKNCTLADATSCRNNASDLWGDYECRNYGNIFQGFPNPLCDFGPSITCGFWDGSNYDCASIGDGTNSTKMSCRGLDGQVKANKFDKSGYCYDDTASGTQTRNPLPTP